MKYAMETTKAIIMSAFASTRVIIFPRPIFHLDEDQVGRRSICNDKERILSRSGPRELAVKVVNHYR